LIHPDLKLKEIESVESFVDSLPDKIKKEVIDFDTIDVDDGWLAFENIEEAMDVMRAARGVDDPKRLLDYKGNPKYYNNLMQQYDAAMTALQNYAKEISQKEGYDGIKWFKELDDYADVQYQIWNQNKIDDVLKTRSQLKAEWDAN
jgi:hypothetical protein